MEQPKPEQFKVRRRPVAAIVTADLIGLAQGLATAVGMINGLWPSAVAAPGPISRILPFVLIVTVTLCLGGLWRMIFHHVARTRSVVYGAAWVALALLIWGVCVGTSGRYMAALVDGASAVRAHEEAFLQEIGAAARSVEAQAALDRPLVDIAAAEARNLRGVQDGDRRYGTISGKPGGKGVTDVVGREADAFDALATILRALDSRRTAYLADADRQLGEARNAAALGREEAFINAATAAGRLLKQAGAINLLNAAGGLGAGMVVDSARVPFEQAKREVDQFVGAAREKRAEVDVPVFTPMPDKDAVWVYPPLLGWIFAVMLESFPVFAVIALLLSNLDGQRPALAPAE